MVSEAGATPGPSAATNRKGVLNTLPAGVQAVTVEAFRQTALASCIQSHRRIDRCGQIVVMVLEEDAPTEPGGMRRLVTQSICSPLSITDYDTHILPCHTLTHIAKCSGPPHDAHICIVQLRVCM